MNAVSKTLLMCCIICKMLNVAKLLVQIYKAQLAMHEIDGSSKNMTFFPILL